MMQCRLYVYSILRDHAAGEINRHDVIPEMGTWDQDFTTGTSSRRGVACELSVPLKHHDIY